MSTGVWKSFRLPNRPSLKQYLKKEHKVFRLLQEKGPILSTDLSKLYYQDELPPRFPHHTVMGIVKSLQDKLNDNCEAVMLVKRPDENGVAVLLQLADSAEATAAAA